MLIIPMTNKINLKNPPFITLTIILINVFIFLLFQRNDNQTYIDAEQYYVKSGLAAIEVPFYIDYVHDKMEKPLKGHKQLNHKVLYEYHIKMESDFEFLKKLANNEIIPVKDPKFHDWKEMRAEYAIMRARCVSFKYGFKPAYFEPLTLLTSIFLHGGIGHLFGNMVFLWLVGCILEAGCGRLRYAISYIMVGICANLFFKLAYFESTIPLIGASGAIAGLMGMLAILFGKKTIRVFYSLGFFFDYIRIRAIILFFLWIANELVQLFWGPVSNVAYVAHIGGLLAGGAAALILLKIPDAVDKNIFKEETPNVIGPLIEKALQKAMGLDIKGAIIILNKALEKEPGNIQVLTQLFKLHKQTPEKQEFHGITEKMISSLIRDRENYIPASEVFKEYQALVKTIKLPASLLVRLCFVWCELGDPDKAGKMITVLQKANKNIPGLPTALFKTSLAFKKKGKIKNFKKCQNYICLKYPHSHEASLVLNSIKKG